MMIPKEKIDEVRERASIVDVISDFVPLKKKGANYMGLCPFHSEKTPSFSVSEEKKLFYCFGCHSSGDAIAFLMKKEGVEFPHAVRALAGRYGVRIEEGGAVGSDPRDVFFRANTAALDYFTGSLASAAGSGAREYLRKRGYDPAGDIVKRFSIGFAPKRWDGLINFFKKRGISADAALKAGLLSRSTKDGRLYDRFRARLVFPILDVRGRVVAFGGRALDGGDPKYLNSPETMVFKKGEILYGMNLAKRSIMEKRSVVVVEGYFDLVALHSHGFTNSVATMGTALTPAHVRSFKGLVDTVYTLFDSDRAGRAASVRALELFVEEGVPCRAVTLPKGLDPDDFLRDRGTEAMDGAINRAEPLMEFFLKDLMGAYDLTTPEGKARYLDISLEYLIKVKNVAERDHYAATLAGNLGIPVESVYEAVRSALNPSGGRRGVGSNIGSGNRREPEGAGSDMGGIETSSGKKLSGRKADLRELTVLKVILHQPELLSESVDAAIDAFGDPDLRAAGKALSSIFRDKKDVDGATLLSELADEKVRETVARILVGGEEGFIEAPEKMLDDSIVGILGRGRVKDSTRRMLEKLEEAGLKEMAREMRQRIGRH